ncbi:MAG: hypothetical protein WCK48_04005 [bacterium]
MEKQFENNEDIQLPEALKNFPLTFEEAKATSKGWKGQDQIRIDKGNFTKPNGESIPAIYINEHVFPIELGDEFISKMVRGFGGGSGWTGEYIEKMREKYGNVETNHGYVYSKNTDPLEFIVTV